jgi:hypothetical protein
LGIAFSDAAILLHDRRVIVANILIHGLDFLDRECWHDFQDLFMRAMPLPVGNEIPVLSVHPKDHVDHDPDSGRQREHRDDVGH